MSDDGGTPIRLVEDETGDRFLVYATDKGLRLDIRYEGETLWMTQAQMAALFGVQVPNISRHITNILQEGELLAEGTVSKFETVRLEGGRRVLRRLDHYSLDMIISVGYRVSSAQATLFRRWATTILVQFARKGFVVDTARLKQPDNTDRIAELREVIRDIRSNEANLYAELRRICSLCQDYDGSGTEARTFFRRTQAKLVYAVVSQTPAEIVASRADARAENMGLQSWPNDNIRKSDVDVSKNYLTETEVRELNRVTTILLDIFEDQLVLGRLITMHDAQELLDRQLQSLGRVVLRRGGAVSADDAKRHAETEYEAFDRQRRLERKREADEQIAELAREAKGLPKGRR